MPLIISKSVRILSGLWLHQFQDILPNRHRLPPKSGLWIGLIFSLFPYLFIFLSENTFYKDKTNFHQAVLIFREKIKRFSNCTIRNLTYILIIRIWWIPNLNDVCFSCIIQKCTHIVSSGFTQDRFSMCCYSLLADI